MNVTEEYFTKTLKNMIDDVVIPVCKEYIDQAMAEKNEVMFRQFCEARHVKTIDVLQRALAAVMAAKEDLR